MGKKKRAIEPMRYVPFCDIYTEQQMLGHRVGGPMPPEGTQMVRLLRWYLMQVFVPLCVANTGGTWRCCSAVLEDVAPKDCYGWQRMSQRPSAT